MWRLPITAVFASGAILAGEPGSAITVAIYTQFESRVSVLLLSHMETEVAGIMAPSGYRFEWRSLKDANGRDASAEVLVVRFKGACNTDAALPLNPPTGALGWTHISDGEVLPFSDVDCNRIRQLIALSLAGARPGEREGLLGRALARVIAHEMYHFFSN